MAEKEQNGDLKKLTEILRNGLWSFYGDTTDLVIHEAKHCLWKCFDGDIKLFLNSFFYPTIKILQNLMQTRCTNCGRLKSFQFHCNNGLLLHLCSIPKSRLRSGDFYFTICHNCSNGVHFVVKYSKNSSIEEISVPEKDYLKLLMMDWANLQYSGEDLHLNLQQCLVNFEDGIRRLKVEDIKRSSNLLDCLEGVEANVCTCHKSRMNGMASNAEEDRSYVQEQGPDKRQRSYGDERHSSPQGGSQPPKPGLSPEKTLHLGSPRRNCLLRKIDPPHSITDLNRDILHSGIVILPGGRDLNSCAVVIIFSTSSLWLNQQVVSTDLAKVLMYFHSVPREDIRKNGLTVIADIRGASSSTVNTLLESLYIFEENIPSGASIVHLLADKHTQTLVLKSPVYDPHANFKLDLLMSRDFVHRFVDRSQLPPALDGDFIYSHEDWIQFRYNLDPLVSSCREVAKHLMLVMHDLSKLDYMPKTADETRQLIERQEQQMKRLLDDPQLHYIQNDGARVMLRLQKWQKHLGHLEDYRDAMETVTKLYNQLQETLVKLVKLAETRVTKLEKCHQLREFEEECEKVIIWFGKHGNGTLQKFQDSSDSLKGVLIQQKEFEKFYFAAMTHIEKSNDLIEEASMLSQSGNFDEVSGYKDMSRMLKNHLSSFTGQLEETREKIESTAKCYNLLDKAYEWALEAMKYVASMKMEHSANLEGVDKLLVSLDHYLKEHPPVTEDVFTAMLELADRLQNDKLIEQSRIAKTRCEETHHLLLLRQSTLNRAKEQLQYEVDQREIKQEEERRSRMSEPVQRPQSIETKRPDDGTIWEPRTTSTPTSQFSNYRRLSYAGRPTSPLQEPSFAYSDYLQKNVSSSDFITVDLSNRVVTSIPSGPKDNRPRNQGDSSGLERGDNSFEFTHPSCASPSSHPISALGRSGQNRPQKKVLKRNFTAPVPMLNSPIEEESSSPDSSDYKENRNARTISLITGSSDSLPSLPEEETADDASYITPSRHLSDWTPVPVNTHLHNISSTSSVPTDRNYSETEYKSHRALSLVMSEILQTEKDYVSSLKFIIDNYIPELERDNVPQALRGKRNIIFGNLEKIYQFHSQSFLQELRVCERHPYQIAQYFLMHENQFYLYALYNKNKPKSDKLMAEYGKEFFRRKQLELHDKMDLASYLLKPVQRMGKYALLLKQIIKEYPETEPEYNDLKAAEEMVKFQLRHGNDLLAMDSLRDCDVNLQEQGRLLRQEEFLVWQGRKKSLRHVFLFEDLVLFSKTKRGRQGSPDIYIYKYSFKMSDMGFTENFGDSGYKFEIWFRRRSVGDNYILQAPSSDVKKNWVRDISRLLWSQALRNRECHLSEMATMGIGSKPCMDLKPSADNIQDRFINIAVSGRGARSRNSIAVSSFDYLRNGNKRPHSIISVSSTSSSNSSHSAGIGLQGIYNPSFDHMTDAKAENRQSVVSSNESGIGTDMSSGETDQPQGQATPGAITRTYIDYMKTQVLHLPPESIVATDV